MSGMRPPKKKDAKIIRRGDHYLVRTPFGTEHVHDHDGRGLEFAIIMYSASIGTYRCLDVIESKGQEVLR